MINVTNVLVHFNFRLFFIQHIVTSIGARNNDYISFHFFQSSKCISRPLAFLFHGGNELLYEIIHTYLKF